MAQPLLNLDNKRVIPRLGEWSVFADGAVFRVRQQQLRSRDRSRADHAGGARKPKKRVRTD